MSRYVPLPGFTHLRVRSDDHGNACHTSCHDCMRDYSNLAYHSILDWRLGIDMARLALDPAAPIDFSPPYWAGQAALAVQRLHDALPGSIIVQHAGLDAVEHGRRAYIAAHPLWDTRPMSLHPALSAAQASGRAKTWPIARRGPDDDSLVHPWLRAGPRADKRSVLGKSRQRYVSRHRIRRSEGRWHGQRFFGPQSRNWVDVGL